MVVFIKKKLFRQFYCDLFTNILFELFCMKVSAEEKSLLESQIFNSRLIKPHFKVLVYCHS